jgi:aminoacyl tRNA synthase complex-interacting multifunctional protein 1|tara:strand:+ start:3212 stop:4171 length:960 start_codon:yes stop_codon:yes gene_type:complete
MSADPKVAVMASAFGDATAPVETVDVGAFTAAADGLVALNDHLATRSAVAGHALTSSDAEVYVTVIAALNASSEALPHARRWASFVCARGAAAEAGVETARALTHANAPVFERPAPGEKKASASTSGQGEGEGKKKKEKKEKKGGEPKASTPSTKRMDVSVLDIRVGVITKAWEHPDADKLWVENIDLGEKGVRQICSGLRAFKTKEQMEGARVCVIVNVKPGKLRDVKSDGLVLCTSNADHTEVDFVIPPEGAAVGERVMFAGFEGEPEEVLNPKKKQLDAVSPDLKTNAEGVACYKDIPFTTSAGVCTSPLKDCHIK